MKSKRSTIKERQNQIEQYINKNGFADVDSLAEKFGVSIVTMRRDLDLLAENDRIIRTFGGAERIHKPETASSVSPLNLSETTPELASIQRSLAKIAAEMIEDNDVVLMNSSRTASYILEYLGDKIVTIITNNIAALVRNHSRYTTLIMTGGQSRPKSSSLTGSYTINALSQIVATKCILGVRGINSEEGITSSILDESFVNQKMIQQTNGPIIIVADHRKIGRKDSFISGSIKEISVLITDDKANEEELSKISDRGVRVIVEKSPADM